MQQIDCGGVTLHLHIKNIQHRVLYYRVSQQQISQKSHLGTLGGARLGRDGT